MFNSLEAFVKFRFFILLAIITVFGSLFSVSAQVDSVIGQVSSSNFASNASGISGNGRFIVFESTGNLATENPRNSDGNREIFLFDYAQRRIFQITDTKSLLIDPDEPVIFSNVKVDIVNVRPTISNDGRWIAFGSNATYAYPGNGTIMPIESTSNPGNFDANSFTDSMGNNNLVNDGNTEMWLYQVPAVTPVDLTLGTEIPLADLSVGTFTRITNTLPTVLPAPGNSTTLAVISDDNRDVSISDNGNVISFTSNRNLVPAVGNQTGQSPREDNDEIFTYVRGANVLGQVTKTFRGTVTAPIFNMNSTISGDGTRVAFGSNSDVDPIVGMTGGSNADRNLEIYFSDLDANGSPTGRKEQVTRTARTNPGDIVNTLNFGRRMSRDGRYIAFDSFANIDENGVGATNATSFALYLFDANPPMSSPKVRQIGPRSDADSGVVGGEVNHYPGFTDYNGSGTAQTLVLNTRVNITAAGTVPSNADDGLNSGATRPPQIYSYDLTMPAASATFKRLTKLPALTTFIFPIQALTTDSATRIAFNLGLTEVGTGNPDTQTEVYYLLTPVVNRRSVANLSFATGASRIPVSPSPVPTPSPTATPTPTPTPSPSPTATPTPTPQTPPAVQGVSPGMLAIVNYDSALGNTVRPASAEGSLSRQFTLPIELGGVSVTINGVACGLQSVGRREIFFVVPPALSVSSTEGTSYPIVIHSNGTVIKGNVTVVTARPDIFAYSFTDFEGTLFTNRARIFNATNRVLTREPFTVRTIRYRGGLKVPTVLRLYLTGIEGAPVTSGGLPVITVKIGNQIISGTNQVLTGAVLRGPGVYSVDFILPPELDAAGDVPVIFSIIFNGITYQSRLEDTAPRVRIL